MMTVFRKFHTLFRIFKEEIQEDLKVLTQTSHTPNSFNP